MPPDPLIDDDYDQYASSQDSDFAPDEAQDRGSEHSDSDGEEVRRPHGKVDKQSKGYDNSGDEAIIQKGRKRQKKTRNKDGAYDSDGGEGGLVKTRRQRAEEKAGRKLAASNEPITVDVDALWEQMISGKPAQPSSGDSKADEAKEPGGHVSDVIGLPGGNEEGKSAAPSDITSETVHIKRTYNFAGRVHTEEKVVARDSAEARLYLASQVTDTLAGGAPTKRATKKAFRSAFEPVIDAGPGRTDLNLGVTARMKAAQEAQAKKLNTVEKSRMDWAGYVDKEGIKNELELASKAKGSYNAREEFLARSAAIRDEDARRARMTART